jgi:hypothetical protein
MLSGNDCPFRGRSTGFIVGKVEKMELLVTPGKYGVLVCHLAGAALELIEMWPTVNLRKTLSDYSSVVHSQYMPIQQFKPE